jgi:hypothetical protein
VVIGVFCTAARLTGFALVAALAFAAAADFAAVFLVVLAVLVLLAMFGIAVSSCAYSEE